MSSPHVVVVGDALLDRVIGGPSRRSCPDAPIPVIDVNECHDSPGGAGLAALLAAHQGATVHLVTGLGADTTGMRLRELLVPHAELIEVPLSGRTPEKTRVCANDTALARMDIGRGQARSAEPLPEVLDALWSADVILVSDYGRGLTGLPWLRTAIEDAATVGTPVVWDPHPNGSDPVAGTTLLTPNEREAAACGFEWDTDTSVIPLRWALSQSILVTRGEQGALLAMGRGSTVIPIPVQLSAGPGADTCGAGDVVAATAAVSLANGGDVIRAAHDAISVASVAVAAGGPKTVADRAMTVDPVGEYTGVSDRSSGSGGNGRLVATGGCFDLLHAGHVTLLRQAKALGERLVVCLNSDDSIRRSKGAPRPIMRAQDRAQVLRALEYVDDVIVFDEDTPARVLAELRPDIWVKGDDYDAEDLPETPVVRAQGGEVVILGRLPGYSTSELVRATRAS